MKCFKYIYIILFWLYCHAAMCQNVNDIQSRIINTIPSEKLVVHLNDDVLIAGETLYYKILCLNSVTDKASYTSKIAYVALIGEGNNTLFKHKVKLLKGIGYSQFFIPADVNTGNYKLIAYTQWMKNNNKNPFFQKDIFIINPYIVTSNITDGNLKSLNSNSLEIRRVSPEKSNNDSYKRLILKTDAQNYQTRCKVSLAINNALGATTYGNYTLSVRLIDSIEVANKLEYTPIETLKKNKQFYLPEIRGEIISGYVVSKENPKNVQPDVIVSLSITGKTPVFKNVITDKRGKFFFNIHESYTASRCILQILDENREDLDFRIDDKSFKDTEALEFKTLYLNPDIKDWLTNRSIYTQIDNAYNEVKQDSMIYDEAITSFYGEPTISYKLDDYKRFTTVKETFTEVIEGAGVRKNKDAFTLKVYHRENFENIGVDTYQPLVLVDGLLIQDYGFLVDYNPFKIENISLLKGIYFNGPSIFDGIIDVRTKTQDFSLPLAIPGLVALNLSVPQTRRLYIEPNYDIDNENLKRIPDYRHQLLWKPNITLNSASKTIEFYTSDIEGVFEIILEGYTINGNAVTSKTHFKVKK